MAATLTYWACKARNYAILAVAQHGGFEIHQNTDFDMAALKPSLPFGQLPYLEHGDVKIAQSLAILRYVARKTGLTGNTDVEAAKSEMLIEEANDIYNTLAKAQYSADKVAAFNGAFAADGPVQKQLGYLEKLVNGPYFNSTPLAGDIAIAAVLDLLVHLEPTVLETHPKLKAFYDELINSKAFAGIKDLPMYFSRS